ncbi:hypothetical protein [Halorientalis litorea]|uniref:hypothetical protein n=1 Tax=Halorientalis litorea TaxID=2931977 RepID=UPI001FF47FE8|nr:hypothetical protein [Halorientalis litorea]
MTDVYVGPSVLVALGSVGELDLLTAFDGTPVVPESARTEVTTEPAKTNLDRFCDDTGAARTVDTDWTDDAMAVLDTTAATSDTRLLEGVLAATDATDGGRDGPAVGLVSDDRRLRTVAEGFGATVTGTFGVVVRAASEDKYVSATQAKRIVRRIDSHGLHLTGEMREQAVGSTES